MRSLIALLIFFGTQTAAQGFAGLGASSDGFKTPQANTAFVFPQDHGAHPDYRIEWWYLTATLTDSDGTSMGLQWTLFRSALRPETAEGWPSAQLWMGHAAVTTPDAHFVSERRARGGIGQAGVSAGADFSAWIDDWEMTGAGDLNALTLSASGPGFTYDMDLAARGPIVFQGEDGYSVKSSAGQASYYYSQPFFDISGEIDLPGGTKRVTGKAWLDREWSSQPLASDQTGWDWFSLSFEDGARLMGFRLRSDTERAFTSATWITADGKATPYANGAFRAEPQVWSDVDGKQIPTTWRVWLPEQDVDVTVAALNPNSWMATSVPYWEGPISAAGSHTAAGILR